MNNKISGLLGMARRANRLSLGHDASEAAIKDLSARVCVVSDDASDRLKEEMRKLCELSPAKPELIFTELTMNELGMCLGAKSTAVLTVNDSGFAERIIELTGRKTDI